MQTGSWKVHNSRRTSPRQSCGQLHIEQELVSWSHEDEDINTTRTAAYAAVDANISALLAFVMTLTLTEKRTVNMAMTPSCASSSFRTRKMMIAPSSRKAATRALMIPAAQLTWLSMMCSVSSVNCVVLAQHRQRPVEGNEGFSGKLTLNIQCSWRNCERWSPSAGRLTATRSLWFSS